MLYKAIGLMSGSSLDGLDIAYLHLYETGGKWTFELAQADCYPYTNTMAEQLRNATQLNALNYQLLHTQYGHYIGQQVNQFIATHHLEHKVDIIASHGHTTFHIPAQKTTAQLGDGAAIAATTALPVVTELRAVDIALGGQGAPIVPIGEKLLWSNYPLFLNLGGIANISYNTTQAYTAFDVCPANRVLNMLVKQLQLPYDNEGSIARSGQCNEALLTQLNELAYYQMPYPKSLSNDFGTDIVYPMVNDATLSTADKLATVTEHIALQIKNSLQPIATSNNYELLVTGGGAHNHYLTERIQQHLQPLNIKLTLPNAAIINYKEAIVMALIGVLRWREENNVLSSVTGASRSSVNGALWMGQS
jgi:anhydro-N-acetylmuramic acid kinase